MVRFKKYHICNNAVPVYFSVRYSLNLARLNVFSLSLSSCFLFNGEMLYRLYLALRHLCYDKGWKKTFEASVPTVCVGNVTVGGTGKTPHTEMLLEKLQRSDAWGFRPLAVLSRGYKRRTKGFQRVFTDSKASHVGDEPLQMARKFLAVQVAVDRDRVHGCDLLAKEGAELIVLDDAFQYRRLRARLNIVLVDYNRPVFKDRLLPWGRLRDLPSQLGRAQMVIVTKCPPVLGDWERQQWRRQLKLRADQQLFFTTIAYGSPESVFPDDADARFTYSPRLILVSGIASDAPLRSYLSDDYKITARLQFPDHHKFTRRDLRRIDAAVGDQPTACVMTTEKDAQRLRDAKKVPERLRQRLFYLPIRVQFLSPEEDAAFTEALLSAL